MVSRDAKEVAHKVNQVVISPLRVISNLMEHVKPFIDSVKQKAEQKRKRHDEDEE